MRTESVDRRIASVVLMFSGIALVAALLHDADVRNAIWAHATSLVCLVGLQYALLRRSPPGELSLVVLLMYAAIIPAVALVLLLLVGGDVTYATINAEYSHVAGAWRVAWATILLHGAMAAPGVLRPHPRALRRVADPVQNLFGRRFLTGASVLMLAHWGLRVVLLFGDTISEGVATYAVRLFLAFFQALFFFVGIGVRRGMRIPRLTAIVSVPAALIVVLAGSRADALFPIAFMVLGFLMAAPVRRKALVIAGAVTSALFIAGMFVGDVVRRDERGRTGQAAMERVGEIRSSVSSGAADFGTVTLGRLVSNSQHAVITRVPDEIPHESDGILSIPFDFVRVLLPRLNYSGISETEQPRNWLLNDFGFLVNWRTSVELNLVADAWYRGGDLGLIIVGLIVGFALQLTEALARRTSAKRGEYVTVLLFLTSTLLFIEGRDVVTGLRSIVMFSVAGFITARFAGGSAGPRSETGAAPSAASRATR